MERLNRKNQLLLAGVVFFGLLSYQLAIKKTKDQYFEYSKARKEQATVNQLPFRLNALKAKERELDEILGSMNLNGGSQQSELLKLLNQEIEGTGVRIKEFLSPHRSKVGEEVMNTYRFTLKGDFVGILKVINTIENSKGFGAVTHIDYQKKRNYRSGRTDLFATVLLSQFE
ncbi:hypothetical protein [Aureicoccus marinus]|uniref:General secretion pathway protein n=1 Tax=Aureicoccus marinus TaxID=754435 RepID=A0A2S7T775_9FLAO|nr:hypothetical protein [Aureicoccus marinus]PQJ15306.1 hypothetical protein BST99_05760 [Aureicoccus marinus]